MRIIACRFLMLLVAASALCHAARAATEDPQVAVWKNQEAQLDFWGFTTKYSCDGLREKVRQVLLALGARRDLTVTPEGCVRAGGPEQFPSVKITMATLQPVPATGPVPNDAVEVAWKKVVLTGPSRLDAGDCELAELVRRVIVPLFASRNVAARTDCVPYQESAGNPSLTLEVLVPEAP